MQNFRERAKKTKKRERATFEREKVGNFYKNKTEYIFKES